MITVVCKEYVYDQDGKRILFDIGMEYSATFDGERVGIKRNGNFAPDGFEPHYIVSYKAFNEHFYIKDPRDIVRLKQMSQEDLWQEYLQELCAKWGFERPEKFETTDDTGKPLI